MNSIIEAGQTWLSLAEKKNGGIYREAKSKSLPFSSGSIAA
jgi:hypothetical protein